MEATFTSQFKEASLFALKISFESQISRLLIVLLTFFFLRSNVTAFK